MPTIRESSVGRKWFFSSGLGMAVLLGLIRFVMVPMWSDQPTPGWESIATSVLDALLVAILATMVITAASLWFLSGGSETNGESLTEPRFKELLDEALTGVIGERARIIAPSKIAGELRAAQKDATEWWYFGHTGRHFRSKTLPDLASACRATARHMNVHLQIIDPLLSSVCSTYANYMLGVRTEKLGEQPLWNEDLVRIELCATLVSVYCWNAAVTALDVEVTTKPVVSLFRADLSDRVVVITKEDPQESARVYNRSSTWYDQWRQELYIAQMQGRKVEYPEADDRFRGKGSPVGLLDEDLTETVLRSALGDWKMLTSEFVSSVAEIAREARNPYER